MSELTEFLLARIGEDEEAASRLLDVARYAALQLAEPRLLGTVQVGWHAWPDVQRMTIRVLAECEAKRQIIEDHEYGETPGSPVTRARELRLLTLPYKDHPDFREEWKP